MKLIRPARGVNGPAPLDERVDDPGPGMVPVSLLPAVNLLPASYARRLALGRAKMTAAVAVGLAVLAVALGWLITSQQVSSAQERLDVATAERVALAREATRYAEVPRVFQSVAEAQSHLATAMGNEIRWSFFLNDLALTMPQGVALDALRVSGPVPGASASGDLGAGIGSMDVQGKALGYPAVANWLDALAKMRVTTDPYLGQVQSATSEGRAVLSFSGSASLTPDALSRRFLDGTTP